MSLTILYLSATTIFPGLLDTPVATLTDAEIRSRFVTIRTHLERDVAAEVAQVFHSSGRERAMARHALRILVPRLHEARRIDQAAFSIACAEARRAVLAAE